MHTSSNDRFAVAALVALIILQAVMLASLFAGVAPHPPAAIALFGMAPFIAASLSAAAAAIIIGPAGSVAGRAMCTIAALMALLSFGPQKYFDPQFANVWPAVLSGQIAAVTALLVWRKQAE